MSYDDIRFSWWDDPDEDSEDNTDEYNPWEDAIPGYYWENPDIIGEEEVYYGVECECEICGRLRFVDMSGRCHMCAANIDG